jgi:hypothetical protein
VVRTVGRANKFTELVFQAFETEIALLFGDPFLQAEVDSMTNLDIPALPGALASSATCAAAKNNNTLGPGCDGVHGRKRMILLPGRGFVTSGRRVLYRRRAV